MKDELLYLLYQLQEVDEADGDFSSLLPSEATDVYGDGRSGSLKRRLVIPLKVPS